ncbi:prepilin peptidase [Gallibacterium genomosp. 3]|uniref:prepilin peptidase n=1 Tax=Gallibacterium genomosp. 3 TaxID=505345 RepID=UPI0009F1A798|nr:prepilin peptidase [Gallibacterium genomosp. 3]
MILILLLLMNCLFLSYLYVLPSWLPSITTFPITTFPTQRDWWLHSVFYLGLSIICYLQYTLWWHILLHYCLFSFCYLIAYIDYRYRLISVLHCYTIILLALLFAKLGLTPLSLEQAIVSFTIAFLASISVYFGCYFLLGKDKLGLGDVLLFSALSLLLYPAFLSYFLLISCIMALLFVMVFKRQAKTLPFAPSLIFSALILFIYNR